MDLGVDTIFREETKELQDLLHELRRDINYCKISYKNDIEINNANNTLVKVEKLVKKLTTPIVSQRSELLAFKRFISKTPQEELEYYSDEEFTDFYIKAKTNV